MAESSTGATFLAQGYAQSDPILADLLFRRLQNSEKCDRCVATAQKRCRSKFLPLALSRDSQNGGIFSHSTQESKPPPRPRRIILVRHGESQGNIDESCYTKIPDSKIALTEDGWRQAIECGKRIRNLVESDGAEDWKVYFYVSPYKRTLQTLRAMGMAFERERIAGVREEPRLREQDFGNFQDRERMRVEKAIRLRYGRFFYRFPNGESAADVYDRITGFRETLRGDIEIGRFQRPEEKSNYVNLIIVSHGLTLRVFLMRWYKWTVDQFEGLWNFGNTGSMVMELGPGGRYSLLVHHTREELKAFGMTDIMIEDQEWQKYAKPGELNYEWFTSGPSFFSHFDAEEGSLDHVVPDDIARLQDIVPDDIGRYGNGAILEEPPVGWPS